MAVIVTRGDVGREFRLLRQAQWLTHKRGIHVDMIGCAASGLPRDLTSCELFRHWEIYIFDIPFPFHICLSPLIFIWPIIQIFIAIWKIGAADLVIASTSYSYFDVIIAHLCRVILRAKLVLDIAPLTKNDRNNALMKQVTTKLSKVADVKIVSTRGMQVVLRMKGIDSALVHDPPGTQFRRRPEMREPIRELLNIDPGATMIVVPVPETNYNAITRVIKIVQSVDELVSDPVVVIVFCDGKTGSEVEKRTNVLKMDKVQMRVFGVNSDAYWNIMGVADLGICLRASRNGFDVSPELLEMTASGVVTIAIRYGCACEYVSDGKTGFLVADDAGLLKVLSDVIVEKTVDVAKMRVKISDYSLDGEMRNALGHIKSD